MRRAAWALVAVAVAVATSMAACSGGAGEVAPVSLEPVVSTTAAAVTSTAPPTTAVSTTVVDATSPETALPTLAGPMFSDALGVKVDTAPGVNTPGDTRQLLPEGLYVHIAWTADPNDQSVFTVQPDDIPILEAYANAVATYYSAVMTTVTTDDPRFAEYYVDGGAKFVDSFANRRKSGEVGDFGQGVVLRPYVLSDQTTATSAVVLDCVLDGSDYVMRGAVLTGERPIELNGQLATMVLVDGKWMLDQASTEPRACV